MAHIANLKCTQYLLNCIHLTPDKSGGQICAPALSLFSQ